MENSLIVPLFISGIGAVVSIAVSWGKASAESEENKRWRADMEKRLEKCPTSKECELKHSFIEQTLRKVSEEVGEIKSMLMELLKGEK